jgi:hypothetical protein
MKTQKRAGQSRLIYPPVCQSVTVKIKRDSSRALRSRHS